MKFTKFKYFLAQGALDWHQNAMCPVNGSFVHVSDLCEPNLDSNCIDDIFQRYNAIKEAAKNAYFHDEDGVISLSRYKRAAAFVYAVNTCSPLIYIVQEEDAKVEIDPYLLKQRLAFYIGLCSILQDYDQTAINKKLDTLPKGSGIFSYPQLSDWEKEKHADSFLKSVYRDIFFSDIYHNYNLLTMANVFWLLTDKASFLTPDMLLSENESR